MSIPFKYSTDGGATWESANAQGATVGLSSGVLIEFGSAGLAAPTEADGPAEPIWNPLDTPEFRECLDAYTRAMAKASLFDPCSVNASFETRKALLDFIEVWGVKEVARCRAEGGVTCNKTSSELASNAATAAPGDLTDKQIAAIFGPYANIICPSERKRIAREVLASNSRAAPAIPGGWQLVPVEPTEEMMHAGDVHMDGVSQLGDAWASMLAAAQSINPPVGAAQEKTNE